MPATWKGGTVCDWRESLSGNLLLPPPLHTHTQTHTHAVRQTVCLRWNGSGGNIKQQDRSPEQTDSRGEKWSGHDVTDGLLPFGVSRQGELWPAAGEITRRICAPHVEKQRWNPLVSAVLFRFRQFRARFKCFHKKFWLASETYSSISALHLKCVNNRPATPQERLNKCARAELVYW